MVGVLEAKVVLVLELVLLVDGALVFRKVSLRVVYDLVIGRGIIFGIVF